MLCLVFFSKLILLPTKSLAVQNLDAKGEKGMNFTTVYHEIGQLFILSNFFGNIHNGRFFCLYRIFNLKGNLRGSRGEGILSPLAWNKLSLILSEELLTKMHLSLLTLHRCGTSIWALSLSLSPSFFLSVSLSLYLSFSLSICTFSFLHLSELGKRFFLWANLLFEFERKRK